jgi:hypothetical protein
MQPPQPTPSLPGRGRGRVRARQSAAQLPSLPGGRTRPPQPTPLPLREGEGEGSAIDERHPLTFRYDCLGRRVEKQVSTWSGTAWTVAQTRVRLGRLADAAGNGRQWQDAEGYGGLGRENRLSRFSSDRGWLCASILCFVWRCALLFGWIRSHCVGLLDDAFSWTPSSDVLVYVGSVDGYVRAGYLHGPNIRSVGPPFEVAKSFGLFIVAGPDPDLVRTLIPRKLSFLRRQVDWWSCPPLGALDWQSHTVCWCWCLLLSASCRSL